MKSEALFVSELRSLQRLWQLAGPYRMALVAAVIFRGLQTASMGLAFYAAVFLVTHVMEGGAITTSLAWQITGIAALSLAGQLCFSYLHVKRAWDASFQVGRDLRLQLLKHLQSLPMGFHLSRQAGDLTTVITTDIFMMESFLSDALAKIVQAIVLPAVLILFIALRTPSLALPMILPILIGAPFIFLVARHFAPIGIARQHQQAEAGSVMIEYVQGIQVVRAFNRIAKGQANFSAALERFRAISVRMVVLLAFPMVAYAAVIMLGVPTVAGAATLQLSSIPPAILVTTLMLVFAVYMPLVGLAAVLERIRVTDGSLQRFEQILSSKPLPLLPQETPEGVEIEFSDVSFAYTPEKPTLSGISFSCKPHSLTAIIGPSGSGKTTILNLLPRFWDVAQGKISIGGADIRAIAPTDLTKLISVVFQDGHLFSGSVRDNITAGDPGIEQAALEAAAKAARAHDFIMAMEQGYDTPIGEGGMRLSGGERQRIAIARAILKDAPIVLLDEATAALDPTNERAIQAALSALVENKTLIVVAHKLSTIEAADQILVLQDGRITERGTHAQLIGQNGLYARMHSRKSRTDNWRVN